MGGWATYKLGLSYPDLFAKAVVMAGPQVCGIRVEDAIAGYGGPGPCTDEGQSKPLLANAIDLPYYIAHGGVDELVPVSGVIEQVQDMMALGLRVRFELFPSQDHLGWAVEDLFASPAANMGHPVRPRSPHAVSLTWYPALHAPTTGSARAVPIGCADFAPATLVRASPRVSTPRRQPGRRRSAGW